MNSDLLKIVLDEQKAVSGELKQAMEEEDKDEGNFQNFSNATIPPYLKDLVDFQDAIGSITLENYEEKAEIVSNLPFFKKFLSRSIGYIKRLVHYRLAKELKGIAYFLSKLHKLCPKLELAEFLNNETPKLTRYLYDLGDIPLSLILQKKERDYTIHKYDHDSFYFVRENPKIDKNNQLMQVILSCNQQYLDDFIEYGWPKNSLGYAIKFDDVDLLRTMTEIPEKIYVVEMKYSYAHFSNDLLVSTMKYAVVNGSFNVVKYLLSKNFKMTSNAIENSAVSGNVKLYKFLAKKYKTYIEPRGDFVTAAKYYRLPILNITEPNGEEWFEFYHGCARAVVYLEEADELPLEENADTGGPDFNAYMGGERELAYYWVDHGSHYTEPDDHGDSLFTAVCRNKDKEFLDLIKKKGGKITELKKRHMPKRARGYWVLNDDFF